MNIFNKIESVLFLYCRLSLFLKDPFPQITSNQACSPSYIQLFISFDNLFELFTKIWFSKTAIKVQHLALFLRLQDNCQTRNDTKNSIQNLELNTKQTTH